jgi:hypothetical protein
MPVLGVAMSLLVFVFVILVDNVFARLKWQTAIRSAWFVAVVFGFGNILVLSLLSAKPAVPVVAKPAASETVPAAATPALNHANVIARRN